MRASLAGTLVRRCAIASIVAMLMGAVVARSLRAQAPGTPPWHMIDEILASIKAPTFPNRDFPITDFGAKNDGTTDCKDAIAKAITACNGAGGGRVVVPKGKWAVNGPIHLKSNVNLHVEAEATLLFSAKPEDYLPVVLARFEGTEFMNYSPLIYAMEQENIAVTGAGTLDGQASSANWWTWKNQGGGDSGKLVKMAEDGIPPEQRKFGEGFHLRPNFFQPYRCKNVLVEGVTIVGSPMWELNPVLCENVTITGVMINSHGPNNDGCDPESCKNVLIEKCTFDTGDDCIAIKSGRNADGRRINKPSENIIIRGCKMKDGHGGVTLGSEMSGGIRNVFVEDCNMSSPNLDRAIRLKSNTNRGGYLENLFVRNVEVGEVKQSVLHIDLKYMKETGKFIPTVRNIYLDHVSSKKSEYPLMLLGIEEAHIENVVITNCTFANAKKPSVLEFVGTMVFKDVTQPQ